MRDTSHHTLIASVRIAVQTWRKRQRWSRESVTAAIIETFERMDGPAHIGLTFDPVIQDSFERSKVNADRVFRWLDDETKDNNLLPPNFLPYVLAALPIDLRIACVDELLRDSCLSVRMIEQNTAVTLDAVSMIKAVAKEGGDATSALAALVDGAGPGELENAQRELTESIAAQQEALAQVEAELSHQVRH